MFRFANENDRQGLIELWYDCFGDSEKYVSPFLDTFLKEDTAFVCEESGKIVSAVYALDCFIGDRKACYFYAVATDNNFRRRGLARKEIEFLIDYKSKKGAEIFLLTASSEKNNNYYKHLGFEDAFYCEKKTFERKESSVKITEDFKEEEIISLRNEVFKGNKFVSFPKEHILFALKFSEKVFVWRENSEINGYALTDGKTITELCCKKDTDLFVSSVLREISLEKADVYVPSEPDKSCKISRGMVYCFNNNLKEKTGEDVFLSLNLE